MKLQRARENVYNNEMSSKEKKNNEREETNELYFE